MIYVPVETNEPIRQGDIFSDLPLTTINLNSLVFKHETDEQFQTGPWSAIENKSDLTARLDIVPTWAIVLSQDCDTIRKPTISLCRIDLLNKIIPDDPSRSANGWQEKITGELRKRPHVFYLPSDLNEYTFKIGFPNRMFANFETVFQIDRKGLEDHRELRKGRLNTEADEHYRESASQYFRRYPYEEHYTLTKDETDEYERKKKVFVDRRDYQK